MIRMKRNMYQNLKCLGDNKMGNKIICYIDNREEINSSQLNYSNKIIKMLERTDLEIKTVTLANDQELKTAQNKINEVVSKEQWKNTLFVIDMCLDRQDADPKTGNELAENLEESGYSVLRVSARSNIPGIKYIYRAINQDKGLDLYRTSDTPIYLSHKWFINKEEIDKIDEETIRSLLKSESVSERYLGCVFYKVLYLMGQTK